MFSEVSWIMKSADPTIACVPNLTITSGTSVCPWWWSLGWREVGWGVMNSCTKGVWRVSCWRADGQLCLWVWAKVAFLEESPFLEILEGATWWNKFGNVWFSRFLFPESFWDSLREVNIQYFPNVFHCGTFCSFFPSLIFTVHFNSVPSLPGGSLLKWFSSQHAWEAEP